MINWWSKEVDRGFDSDRFSKIWEGDVYELENLRMMKETMTKFERGKNEW